MIRAAREAGQIALALLPGPQSRRLHRPGDLEIGQQPGHGRRPRGRGLSPQDAVVTPFRATGFSARSRATLPAHRLSLDRRPDRRHPQFRPRRPALGHAGRTRIRRPADCRRRLRTGDRPDSGGRCKATARIATISGFTSRKIDRLDESVMFYSSPVLVREGRAGRTNSWSWSRRRSGSAASAISTASCWSPRGPANSWSSTASTPGTWRRSRSSSRKPAAGLPTGTERRRSTRRTACEQRADARGRAGNHPGAGNEPSSADRRNGSAKSTGFSACSTRRGCRPRSCIAIAATVEDVWEAIRTLAESAAPRPSASRRRSASSSGAQAGDRRPCVFR